MTHPIAPARGILIGIGICVVFWLAVGWALFGWALFG